MKRLTQKDLGERKKTKTTVTVSDLNDPNGHIISCDLEKEIYLIHFCLSVCKRTTRKVTSI